MKKNKENNKYLQNQQPSQNEQKNSKFSKLGVKTDAMFK
jgi:hypothetical protein